MQTILHEGIAHLEDLSIQQFIKTVETLKEKIITEKLDGSNLWFGYDDKGFFTSREGKSSKSSRFYSETDYVAVAAYNGFRAAHIALETVKSQITQILKEGDLIEVEIMFGRQPNTVTYGVDDKNFIVMLRAVDSSATERFEKLSKLLNKKTIGVTSTVISSDDGEKLTSSDVKMQWQIVEVAPISLKHVDLHEVGRMLESLKKFLSEKNTKLRSKTNGDVAEINLGSIGKADREVVKTERQRINDFLLSKYKKPIKDLLLNTLVRKIKPALQTDLLHPDEDLGVEGIVIRDPKSGEQAKLVDKDTFTAINSFNSSIRNSISGPIRTSDQDAPIDDRGGILGQSKIRIASLLGAKELAVTSTAKKFVSKLKGIDAQATAKELAASLNITSVHSVKAKILAILGSADSDIEAELQKFKSTATEIKLNLKTGKQIGMSPDVIGRTLTSFAETKADIAKLKKSVSASSTPEELVLALYGRVLTSLFKEENMKFNLLRAVNEDGEAEATTTSSAVEPVEKRIFKGGKPIVSKVRKFQKAAKFKRSGMFPSTVPESFSSFNDIKFAKDVDDNSSAVKDPEFKTLRNNITVNNANSQMDVSKYLQKAHEINDEVDSVAFGMENSDGSIMKVWVNAQHADDFEKALADSLGKEDDAEIVINNLANTYDIIDVEWPKQPEVPEVSDESEVPDESEAPDESEVETAEVPDESEGVDLTLDKQIDKDVDGESSQGEDEPDIFLGTKSDEEEDDKEESEDHSDGEEGELEQEPDELEDEPDSQEDELEDDADKLEQEPEDESDGQEDELEDDTDDTDELEDEQNDELEDDEQPPTKKKKINKEQTVETFGQKFKNKMLSEAKNKPGKREPVKVGLKSGKLDAKSKELSSFFPAVADQAVISIMISLGAPVGALELHKSELRDGIVSASKMFKKNSAFKMWTTKLTNALDSLAAGGVTEQSNFGKQLTNKYQQEVFDVLDTLGLPETITTSAARALKAGIKASAAIIADDSEIRLLFTSMAEQLGVITVGGKNISKVSEAIEPEEDATAIVSRLLSAIGIDLDLNTSVSHQMNRPAVRRALTKITNSGIIKSRLDAVTNAIEEKTIIFAAKSPIDAKI
jgi:hypothetical protein